MAKNPIAAGEKMASFRPAMNVPLPGSPPVFLSAIALWVCILFWPGMASAQFASGDDVSLTKDVPLVFNESKYRDGLAGEVFTVIQYRADIRRVFLLLRDSAGKPFAVSVEDSAVALAPKDHYTALTRGISQLALGDLQTAVQSFEEADRFDGAVSVATGLKTLARTFAVRQEELTRARTAEAQFQPDLQRRLRNARVAARANPLFPGDENKQRGAAIEEEAKQLASQHRMEVEAAEWKAIEALRMGEPVVEKLVTSRCYVAALALDDALILLRRRTG